MDWKMKAIIVLVTHIIGAIIALIVFYKTGEFEEAATHGDGIRFATPSDVVFAALFIWEMYFLLYIFCCIDIFIENLVSMKGDKN